MNKLTVNVLIACALLGAAAIAQDPGFIEKLDTKKHRELMPRHALMLEGQKKQDAELEPLLASMNGAIGEKRVDALIAVINKLIEQRKATQEKMAGFLDQ